MQYDFKDFLPAGVFYVRGGQLEILQYPKVTIPAKGMGMSRSAKGALALQSFSSRPSGLKFPYRYTEGMNNGSYGSC